MTAARPRRTTVRSIPGSGAAASLSPFVGRESELFSLVASLPGGEAHGPRTRLICGDPGIGKSRLAAELAREARRTGHRVVWAHVWEEASAPPYWPWTQVVRELLGERGVVDLAALVLDDTSAADRFQLFDATTEVLRDAAARSPLVVVLDDLHDADPPTLLLLHFAAAHLRHEPVLFVGTMRPTEGLPRPHATELLAGLGGLASRIELEGLGAADLSQLGVSAAEAPRVLAATGGNPLYVEQVLHHEGATIGSAGPGNEALRAVLARRLSRLSDDARELLAARAVVGRDAPHARVASVAEVVDGAIEPALVEAADAGLVDGPGGWFAHPLIVDAALDAVDPDRLARLHHAAAELLGEEPAHAADRARHLLHAGPEHWRAAVDASLLAADVAASAMADEDAVVHLQRARTVVDAHGGDDPALGFEVVFALAGAQMAAVGREAAEGLYREAWELALATDDPALIGRAAARHTIQFFFSGDVAAEHGRQVRRALELVPDDGDDAQRARLCAALATALLVEHPAGAVEQAECAVEVARRSGDPVAVGHALVAQQVADLGPRTLTRRLASAREIIAIAESCGDRDLLVHGRFLLMAALLERGDVGELDAQLSAQHDIVDTIAAPRFARHATWFRATRAMLDGDPDLVEHLAAECYAVAEKLGDPDGPGVFWGQVGVARWMQGRIGEMEPAYVEQRRTEPEAVVYTAVLAWLWSRDGQRAAARGALAELPPPSELPHGQHTLLTLATLAETAVALDDRQLGAAVWEELLPFADHVVPIAMGAATWGAAARPLGALELHLGRVDEGIAHLERAVAVCARLGARPWLTESQLELAEALLDHGRSDDPRLPELLGEAAGTVERCGLAVFTERVAALSTRLEGATTRPPTDVPAEATPEQPLARVAVLGTFEVTAVDGSTPRWTSRKARELLKILVARRGAPVPREVLMDMLWPDEDPDALGNRLSVALSTVRRSLDPGRRFPTNTFVAAEAGAIRLALRRVRVDAEALLAASDAALEAARSNDPAAAQLLRAARALQAGPALPDEPYAPWADGLRGEVDAASTAVLRASADLAEAADDPLGASEAFRGLIEIDPYDEGAHRGLVRTLRALGAHGQADAAADRFRRAMSEIGVPITE